MSRYELTDEQWNLISDLVERPRRGRGRPRRDEKTLLNGVIWVLCSGAAWRDLPKRYGPWQTCYDRFRSWQRDRTLDKLLECLRVSLAKKGLIDNSTWVVDATNIRASRAAAGAKRGSRGRSAVPVAV